MQPTQRRRSIGRSRRLAVATIGVLGVFGASAALAVAPWAQSSASAQTVCFDDQGNVVPCPTVPTTQPPPSTQPPPTLPTIPPIPPTQPTSPPVTAGTTPPPTQPPATTPRRNIVRPRTTLPPATAATVPPTVRTTAAPTTTTKVARTTTTTVAPTTTTAVKVSAVPLAKVGPPKKDSHGALTLGAIALVTILLVGAILGPELRGWFGRSPRTRTPNEGFFT